VKMQQWKVIYVSPRSEKKAALKLLEKGIEAYAPVRKILRQWSDRKKVVEMPVINGYVFVNIKDTQREKVFEVPYIIQYVRFEGKDAIVRNEEMVALKNVIELGYDLSEASDVKFEPSQKVKIEQGPFKGFEGVVITESNEDLIYVALTGINFQLKIKLPKGLLKLN